MRQQMRKIQPKPGAATGGGQTRRQRERYVQAGGMLQGYAPDLVIRLGYIAVGIAVACVLIIAAIVVFVPPIYGLPVAIAASIAWVVPIALLASFIAPGFRLALKDRKAEGRLVQGQLVGASMVSTSMGLGMLMGQTRGGVEQYVDPPVPPVMTRLQQLPLITPIALAVAAIVGDDAVALSPIPNQPVHAGLAVVAGTARAAAVYGVSTFLQRRLMKEGQAQLPKN